MTHQNLLPFYLLLLFLFFSGFANNLPFPTGYDMLTAGTIVMPNHISSRQSWTPACLLFDTSRMFISSAYVNYYDAMDNFRDRSIHRMAIGMTYKGNPLSVKESFLFFDAMGTYQEYQSFTSLAHSAIFPFNISIEISQIIKRATILNTNPLYVLSTGSSFFLYTNRISLVLQLADYCVYTSSKNEKERTDSFIVGMCHTNNTSGSYGFALKIQYFDLATTTVRLGQTLILDKNIAFCTGISTNPLFLHIGISIHLSKTDFFCGFVHHQILGLSEGGGFQWVVR